MNDTDREHRQRTRGALGCIALIACVLLAGLVLPAGAAAKRGLETGFAALEQYQSPDQAERSLWFGRTADAGAGLARLSIGWSYMAPQRPPDPANPGSASYDFSAIDGPVRDAEARGLDVMITVNVAPPWAEGPGKPASAAEGSWMVSPSDLADFDQAVAARYSGNFDPDGAGPQPVLPAVQYLEVWNEPNSSDWLEPQFVGKNAVSPDEYRQLLNASYKSIKSVNPRMQVVAAGTAPYGDPPGGPYPSGVQRVQPLQFWQQLLCVRSAKAKKKKGSKGKKAAKTLVRSNNCPAQPLFDVFAHHPIDNTGSGPLRSGPRKGDISTPDLGRLVSVLRAAERLGTVSGHHPVWVTEFWWDSKPPNPVGAPLLTQARWIEQSLYLFWKAGASAAINFEIRDGDSRPNVHAGFQSGVYFQDGRAKPSLTAFHFPFVSERLNAQKLRAWGKAPEAGKLAIQRQQGARWVTVKRLQVSKGGVFDTTLRLRGKQRLRATVGNSQSLVWKQSAPGGAKASDGGGPGAATIILLLIAGGAFVISAAAILRRRQIQRNRRPRALPS